MEIKNQYVNWSVLVVSASLLMYLLMAQYNEQTARNGVMEIANKIHQSS